MQSSKLYVGNLNYNVTNEELSQLFSAYGEVKHVNIIEGRGFGFVEMSNQVEAENARAALNETEFKGRTLKIDEARPRRERERRPQQGGGQRPRRDRDNRRPREYDD
jgi:RNA recognition motif-containing protein